MKQINEKINDTLNDTWDEFYSVKKISGVNRSNSGTSMNHATRLTSSEMSDACDKISLISLKILSIK